MVRKISFTILSLAILATGIIAFRKLNYWESSVWIFKLNPTQHNEGGIGQDIVQGQDRGQGQGKGREILREERRAERTEDFERHQRSGERFDRPSIRELPDSIREKFAGRGKGSGIGDRNFPDSLRWEFASDPGEQSENIPSDAGFRTRDGRGRGEFRGGKNINLKNVLWYLAVFASFTVVAIYIDKGLRLIRRGKKSDQCQ